LADFFKEQKTRSMMSTEVRVTKDGTGYLIDPTIRAGMPCPTAVELEIYENVPEFIWAASGGEVIDLIPKYLYGAGIALDSDWANNNWLEVHLKSEEIRPFVKFRRAMKKDNRYFAVPGFSSICTILGFGDSVDKAIEQVKYNLEFVSGFELSHNTGGLSAVKDTIESGEKEYNLPF
jgi:hypothetical protein